MNTENNIEKNSITTIGQQLRHAREHMGLDTKDVADQLCLKQSIINDIEHDTCPPEIVSAFFRGYVRYYAKLVNLPEDELLPLPSHLQKSKHEFKTTSFKRSSFTKSSRKRDSWIMPLTWLILLILLGLTGIWWWQNHSLDKQDIGKFVKQTNNAGAMVNHSNGVIVLDVGTSTSNNHSINTISANTTPPATVVALNNDHSAGLLTVTTLLQQRLPAPPLLKGELTAAAQEAEQVLFNTIYINFTKDCWITVIDADKTRLANGLQKKGSSLKLSGKPPYQIRLGVPSAAEITFRGQSIDSMKKSAFTVGS